ncbi:cytochrome c oxidase subunit IVB [Ornithinibacillus bavariensis]|uniref:Cytochrome c oxidase subunit 4B n=1 Tax=Ornithinibacillus bavariensis TaxID=545502 RepID=A0A920C4V3_9BACI|nr:cytochrome c oxidase subunit IVB [Ornithinibacillus bavariensis]GIO26035.1 cytochrome c oxidase subunit 4B [Ornithinibacillus bavariensis]HAM82127.1 cytochrome c oxidase subunit IVB [Ornithinibacillus sp.]
MAENTKSNEFHKQQSKEEMKKQLITFALMIIFTILAFLIVGTEMMSKMVAIPLLLVLALIQVGFQFYYFMHLKDKGHGMAAVMIYGGVWAAFLTVMALTLVIWW